MVVHHIESATLATESRMMRGNNSTTGTGDVSLIAITSSPDLGLLLYVTSIQVSNSGTVDSIITLKDGAGGGTVGYLFVPKAADGGFSAAVYSVPLVCSVGLVFTPASASTTIYASAQGYMA